MSETQSKPSATGYELVKGWYHPNGDSVEIYREMDAHFLASCGIAPWEPEP